MLPFSDEERRRYPYGYTRSRLAILKYIQSRSFRQANLVVFISQFAKSIIDIVVGPRAGKAVVIPHGVNDRFREPGRTECRAQFARPIRRLRFHRDRLQGTTGSGSGVGVDEKGPPVVRRNCCSSGRVTTSTKTKSAG